MTRRTRRERGRRLSPEQERERFDTGGLGFIDSLKRVIAGGRGDEHGDADRREADK
jgi:hypothetical protein